MNCRNTCAFMCVFVDETRALRSITRVSCIANLQSALQNISCCSLWPCSAIKHVHGQAQLYLGFIITIMAPQRFLLGCLLHVASRKVIQQNARCIKPVAIRYLHSHERTSDLVDLHANFGTRMDDQGEKIDLDPFSKASDDTQKSFIAHLNPPLKKSFNLAAYVNSSKTLQELIKIGVSLYDIENIDINAARKLVLLDFEQDCVPYLRFLVDNGLKPKNLGRFISEFPTIFHMPLGDLEIRIKYLKAKRFSKLQIAQALNRSSRIITENVKTLDYKLGEFQVEFDLPAQLVREIASKYPPIISLPEEQYKLVNFTLAQEFGFRKREIHGILEAQPKLLDMLRPVIIERLDLVHNIVGLSHETIVRFPKLITGPKFDIRHRFMYLKKLKRNQFDPKLPLYVSPSALYSGSDEKFCKIHAKTCVNDYKLFLRSL